MMSACKFCKNRHIRSLEMLTVEDFEKIRKAVLVEGLSERKAARKFNHSRKTIKQALKHSVPPGYKKRISPAGAVVLTCRSQPGRRSSAMND